MTETQMPELRTGMLVYTSDGDELGRVKELDSTCLKIDVANAVDFWLDRGSVVSTEFGVARLGLPKDAFNQHDSLGIGHRGMHVHN